MRYMSTATDFSNTPCKLEIGLLGGLSIRVDGALCDIRINRSRQILLLLEYIIANRFVNIPVEQFADILWAEKGEGDEVDNPQGALKNLVWRCRKLLQDALPDSFRDELIIFSGNTYCFNNSLDCLIDTEELEKTYKTLNAAVSDATERIRLLEKVVDLYRGDFLPRLSAYEWVGVRSAYYKRIYTECVNELLSTYLENELYDKAIILSEIALKFEQYNENIHSAYIQALAETNRLDKATAHYEQVSKLFSRDLGISVSPELSRFYNQMLKMDRVGEASIHRILASIDEETTNAGCYYCSFEVLKNIYRVQHRLTNRSKQDLSVAVITVCGNFTFKNITVLMDRLKQSISACLRTADCFTRFSNNQFLLILPNVNAFNSQKIYSRIKRAYKPYCDKYGLSLTYFTQNKTLYDK